LEGGNHHRLPPPHQPPHLFPLLRLKHRLLHIYNETSTDSDLKVSRDADLNDQEMEEKTAGEIEEEERREVIRQNQIKSELSKLPKVGTTAAHKKGKKHGLTPIQVDRKIQELTECIKRGKTPSKCNSCKQTKAYMYKSFYKRGGTKKLYCCANCFNHWSDFYCAEEDYDFLSG
jgi:hypothetical protein